MGSLTCQLRIFKKKVYLIFSVNTVKPTRLTEEVNVMLETLREVCEKLLNLRDASVIFPKMNNAILPKFES